MQIILKNHIDKIIVKSQNHQNKVAYRGHRGNTFFDVTVTGQWSSPSACLPSKVLLSIDRRKDQYFPQFKAEESLIVLGVL